MYQKIRPPPSISDIVYSPQSPTPDDPVDVSVKVTDVYSGVKVVNLMYSTSGRGSWSSLVMNPSSTTYAATIPKQADGTTVQFKISVLLRLRVTRDRGGSIFL